MAVQDHPAYVRRLHEQAAEVGADLARLRHRLRVAASCLKDEYRPLFPATLPVDAEGRRIVSTCGRFALQWVNTGLTSIGSVYCVDLKASQGS